jgi:4-hydroxybenzoate polyprenyltransferase
MGLTAMGQPLHTVRLWLRLGRVSNLPTVWTNTLTGMVLAGGSLQSIQLPMLLIAFTLFYTGGMFLNDAYDREHDRRSRPDRPIPAGLISAHTVFAMGYGMLTIASLIVIGVGRDKGWASAASASVLAGAIVAYDIHHKSNPCGPWIMALCRAFIYIAAAAAISGRVNGAVIVGAAVLFAYVAGFTYAAKQSRTPANTVGKLIAGISLVDAGLMAAHGALGAGAVAALGCVLTRRWQRSIEGT